MLRGKKVIAYHPPIKLQDAGIMADFTQSQPSCDDLASLVKSKFAANINLDFKSKKSESGLCAENVFDVAKIFNRANEMIQIPLDTLCASQLNLLYKKKGSPYLYTEAKVCMALYLRWQALKDGTGAEMVVEVKEETEGTTEKVEALKESFKNPSVPIKIESTEMIDFLISGLVKDQFGQQMRARLQTALKD